MRNLQVVNILIFRYDDTLYDYWSMETKSDIRTGIHCVFNLHVYLVFVTKYRRRVFTAAILNDLRASFSKVCNDFEVKFLNKTDTSLPLKNEL
jgi:hypothetical protein